MMQKHLTIVSGLLLIVVTAVGALAHGHYTNRWNQGDAVLAKAGKALSSTPLEFGPWRMQSEQDFPERIHGILSFANALNRVYVNEKTGQTVAMAMIVGPPGPTSTHTAEMCYSSAGNVLLEDATILTIEEKRGPQEFRRTLFQNAAVEAKRLEVVYSWRQGDNWTAPLVPRATFGGKPYLFKIQVAANYESASKEQEPQSVCRDFLTDLLPALDQHVFSEFTAE